MDKIIDNLIGDLYVALKNKLKDFWPKKGGWFPPEENIIMEMSRMGLNYDYDIYGEVNVQNRSRRDAVLINHKDRWICQAELKLININTYKSGAVLKDVDRVRDIDDLNYALTNYSGRSGLADYSKYGLFVGGDISWWFSWWLGNTDINMRSYFIKKLGSRKGMDPYKALKQLDSKINGAKSGVWPPEPENSKLWLAYALFSI